MEVRVCKLRFYHQHAKRNHLFHTFPPMLSKIKWSFYFLWPLTCDMLWSSTICFNFQKKNMKHFIFKCELHLMHQLNHLLKVLQRWKRYDTKMYSTTSKEDIKKMTVVELQAWLSYHNVPMPRMVSFFIFFQSKFWRTKRNIIIFFPKKSSNKLYAIV